MKNKNTLIKILISLIFCLNILVLSSERTYATSVNEQKLIDLANTERSKTGLNTLSIDSSLSLAAQNKANDMVTSGYFEHFSPNGLTPWDFILNAGYNYTYAGENLAMDFQDSEDINLAWMQSPSHRDNILNPKYDNIGMAVVEGNFQNHPTKMVVQMFGSKNEPVIESFNGLVYKIKYLILGM